MFRSGNWYVRVPGVMCRYMIWFRYRVMVVVESNLYLHVIISDKEHVALLAQEIEKYTAEEYGPSSSIYKSRIQSIRFNLRDRSNPDLRNSIIHGELSCKDFSKLTTQVYLSLCASLRTLCPSITLYL